MCLGLNTPFRLTPFQKKQYQTHQNPIFKQLTCSTFPFLYLRSPNHNLQSRFIYCIIQLLTIHIVFIIIRDGNHQRHAVMISRYPDGDLICIANIPVTFFVTIINKLCNIIRSNHKECCAACCVNRSYLYDHRGSVTF